MQAHGAASGHAAFPAHCIGIDWLCLRFTGLHYWSNEHLHESAGRSSGNVCFAFCRIMTSRRPTYNGRSNCTLGICEMPPAPPLRSDNGKMSAGGSPPTVVRRTRLNPHERERQIVQGAVNFFAEVGFGGQTRELARRLGITQGLLYRYFPSKEALMDRVYQEVFEAKWNPEWDNWLENESEPLRERLIRFYTDYARVIHTYEWVRIFLLSGMAGLDINQRYLRLVRKRIYPQVIALLRKEFGMPPRSDEILTREEEDLMFDLHGMVFFLGIRKWVYRFDLPRSTQELVSQQIDLLLFGAKDIINPKT